MYQQFSDVPNKTRTFTSTVQRCTKQKWDLYISSSFNDVPNKTETFTSAVKNVPNNVRDLLHNSH
jgi:hypothetical protein